ncbi:MAG: hypothetical protein JWQ12_474 [Glaciihabitans sp.]|nr:hypothetical protein [Glaciihabitans sp.]
MQWWNDFLTWLQSDAGWRIISTAVIPFVAIVVAGIVAAAIGRGSSRRILSYQDREVKAAALMALIGAGRKATVWSSLGADEKQHVDNQISEAELRVRLLPLAGANAAADWSAHELNAMKKNSASFSFQAEQTFLDYRDRLLHWQNKPKQARKLFAVDLAQWQYDDDSANAVDGTLVDRQREWANSHVEKKVVPGAPIAIESAPPPPTGPEPVGTSTSERLANAPAPTVPAMPGPSIDRSGAPADSDQPESPVDAPKDSESDSAVVTDAHDPYAPPVTAGTVRDRIAPPPNPTDEPRY